MAHLSHTFDVPVIGPNVGGFKLLLEEGGGILYDNENLEDLYNVLESSLTKQFSSDEIKLIDSKYEIGSISKLFCSKLSGFTSE